MNSREETRRDETTPLAHLSDPFEFQSRLHYSSLRKLCKENTEAVQKHWVSSRAKSHFCALWTPSRSRLRWRSRFNRFERRPLSLLYVPPVPQVFQSTVAHGHGAFIQPFTDRMGVVLAMPLSRHWAKYNLYIIYYFQNFSTSPQKTPNSNISSRGCHFQNCQVRSKN